jgi:hypothetical protein
LARRRAIRLGRGSMTWSRVSLAPLSRASDAALSQAAVDLALRSVAHSSRII